MWQITLRMYAQKQCNVGTVVTRGGQKVDKSASTARSNAENKGFIGNNQGSAKPLCAGSIPARASTLPQLESISSTVQLPNLDLNCTPD